MSNIQGLNEFDCIFISYDEDNAEENWADLQNKVPWAMRVHGVEGSDAAHKAAAELSTTDCFISVDADNIVDEKFFDQEFDFDHPKIKGKALSWGAINAINGLQYGNGGLKLWPKEYVLNMKTHENADPNDKRNQVDFCWEDSYVQMNNVHCTTFPNGSPRQAFRAGFREGVKMTLVEGEKVDKPEDVVKLAWEGNIKRFMTWASVGADVEHGLWAIYGARLGCVMTNTTDWDFLQVRDFEALNKIWHDEVAPQFALKGSSTNCYKTGYAWDQARLLAEISAMGTMIRKDMLIDVAELDDIQSKFFKATYSAPPRMNKLMSESEFNKLKGLNG